MRASVVSAVERALYRRGVKADDLDAMTRIVMGQAEKRWANWPEAA